MDYEDRSGVDDEAQYRCTDGDCPHRGRTWLGKQLLPIVSEVLEDDPDPARGYVAGGVTYRGIKHTGRWVSHIRRCPGCRGSVEKV